VLVQRVELGQPLVLKGGLASNRLQEPGGERSVDPVKEFEKDETDAIALGQQPIRLECGSFSTRPFAPSLERS
jgi:hypothetical protein